MTNPLRPNGVLQDLRASGVDIYDNSMIASFITCPRMFRYRHQKGLIPKHREPSIPLHFGLSVHLALQIWQSTGKDDQQAMQAFVESFTPFEEPSTFSPKTNKELAATYTVLYGCTVLDEYFRRYRNDVREVIALETPLAEEVGDGMFIAGRVDKIVHGQGLVFADYKTSKYLTGVLINPNPQFMTYKFLSEKLTGKPVSGELDMIGVSKTKPVDELLRREPFNYTDYQMEAWRRSLLGWMRRIKLCVQTDEWEQSWRCQPFFRDCDYMPLCTLPEPNMEDRLIETMYDTDYWDPFKETD